MILSVKLNDQNKMGVNWEFLRNKANIRLLAGNPAASLAGISGGDGALKVGFLDGNLGSLVEALETVGETTVIASPRLMVLNKQRAEIQIGEQLGYVNTTVTENASTQSVSFLEVGTLLRLRPFIATDGLIRLEVHPELSTGAVTVQSGLTLPNKSVTQVTTNVMCRDGNTVVLGGLLREDLKNDTKQLPFLGNVPVLGALFRNRTETVDRSEVIALITPRIVCDTGLHEEAQRLGNEFTQRQDVFFDKMNPLGRRQTAEKYYRLAKAAHAAGDDEVAMKHINQAIHHDPLNRETINLRNEIVTTGGYEEESIREYLRTGLRRPSRVDYSKCGAPWKDGPAFEEYGTPTGSQELGVPTPKRTIERKPPGQR
jgi:type IV pilus assembly protein PilQ